MYSNGNYVVQGSVSYGALGSLHTCHIGVSALKMVTFSAGGEDAGAHRYRWHHDGMSHFRLGGGRANLLLGSVVSSRGGPLGAYRVHVARASRGLLTLWSEGHSFHGLEALRDGCE